MLPAVRQPVVAVLGVERVGVRLAESSYFATFADSSCCVAVVKKKELSLAMTFFLLKKKERSSLWQPFVPPRASWFLKLYILNNLPRADTRESEFRKRLAKLTSFTDFRTFSPVFTPFFYTFWTIFSQNTDHNNIQTICKWSVYWLMVDIPVWAKITILSKSLYSRYCQNHCQKH